MEHIERIREQLPDPAKDTKLNLQTVLRGGALTDDQRWGVAVACAIASRNPELRAAVTAEARDAVGTEVLEDAVAAATLMAMNNVYYRFRHVIGKPGYSKMPARLRMNRLVRPATDKTTFELVCLAVSAINGCEACMRSHEKVVLDGGLSEEHVHDAVRIAAVIQAAAVSLQTGSEDASAQAA